MMLERCRPSATKRFMPGLQSVDTSSQVVERTLRYLKVLGEFANLANNPPGSDPSLHNFYETSFNLGMGRKGQKKFPGLLREVLEERKDIKPKHFANLFFRAVQYIE